MRSSSNKAKSAAKISSDVVAVIMRMVSIAKMCCGALGAVGAKSELELNSFRLKSHPCFSPLPVEVGRIRLWPIMSELPRTQLQFGEKFTREMGWVPALKRKSPSNSYPLRGSECAANVTKLRFKQSGLNAPA